MRGVSSYKSQPSRRPKQLSQPKRIWRNFASRINWRLVRKIALVGLLIVVLVQIFFPSGRVLPSVKIAGVGYGWQSTDQLTDVIQQQFEKSSAKLAADDQTQAVKLSELGASIDASKLAEQTNGYNFWWRLVPFSIFFAGGSLTDLQPTFDDGTLSEASDALAESMTIKEAKSGSITINDQNEIMIEAAQDAVDVESSSVQKAVRQASFKIGTTTEVKVESKSSKPAVSNDAIKEVKAKLLAMSSRKIKITNSLTKEVSLPNSTDILAWLNVDENTEVSFDEEAIKNYLIKIAGDSVIAAGTTKVVTMDGKETSRTTGKDGRTVDSDPAIAKIKEALEKASDTFVTLDFKTAAPTVVYDRQFSRSLQGLQTYVDQVTSGGTIQISIKQLTGNGWSVSSRAGESVVSASTYKLYISLLLMKKIDSGEINWTDSVEGTDVRECLRKTIVVSANNCAEYWLSNWGKSNVNNALWSLGFSKATTFSASDAAHTSAADLQKLLIGLYNQSLFSSSNASHLLGLMKQQTYRSGIPKGSSGVVADKVGFLWGYLNDAAIVYHPKGTYVLVIMTNNQSWAKIAEITKHIESLMY